MKTVKLLSVFALMATMLTSCYTEVIVEDDYVVNPTPAITINQLLNAYELWYVDINETIGYGESPFLQIAFTVSFRNGTLYANNNLVGIGSQGNGFGIPIGYYNAYNMILDIDHDIDGYDSFDVYQIDNNTIELYNPFNDTSYFLNGFDIYQDYEVLSHKVNQEKTSELVDLTSVNGIVSVDGAVLTITGSATAAGLAPGITDAKYLKSVVNKEHVKIDTIEDVAGDLDFIQLYSSNINK